MFHGGVGAVETKACPGGILARNVRHDSDFDHLLRDGQSLLETPGFHVREVELTHEHGRRRPIGPA
jgi:hypothetical protein